VLNGTWDFAFRPNGTFNAAEPGLRSVLSVNFSANAEVPGCFDSPTGLRPWVRGTGLYRTRVAVAPHHLLLLHLGAVSLWSAVLVDGELISTWDAGGFTPYWVGPFTTNNSVIEIIIVADNRFDEANRTVTQHANYGFYQFGGILRAVTVHELPSSLQLGISNSSSSGAHGSGTAYWYLKRVEVRVADLASSLLNVSAFIAREPRAVGSAQHGHVLLGLSFGSGGVVANRTVELLPSGEATLQVAVPQPQHSLWSPSSAALQTLTVWLYSGQSEVAVADAICVRFGLRTVAVHDDGRSIALNGAPVKLVGFNRHEMHPVYGSGGIPIEVLREDMQIIKRSHANYIRGSHYLQDQRWLDLCDENGIMVWEEVTAWGNSVADFSNPHFMAAEMITLHSMVDHSANHPCVVIFAFFNEGQSHHPGSTPAYAAMASALRSRDSTRLITWASNRVNASIGWSRGLPDVNLHLGDLVSFNWYPGWYECHVPGCNASMGCSPPDPAGPSCLPPTPQHWWEDKAQWAATAWPRKPFVISETGAGGVSGWHNGTSTLDFALRCRWPGRDEPCWSEEFQREVVASDVRAVVVSSKQQLSQRHASIAGRSVWLLFDAQDNRGNCTGAQCIAHIDTYRPHALNSKGACSEWRQPKQVYYAISKLFDECAIDDV
jgi:beta-glucuronidase